MLAKFADIQIASCIGLCQSEESDIKSAAVVKVELVRLVDYRFGIAGRTEIQAACRDAADDTGFGSERHQVDDLFLGGNIGKSLLLDLPNIRPQNIVVLELSSFMLEDTPSIKWSPNIAVVTNLFPNHLDRHSTMAEYAAAKQNILAFQKPADVAIFNGDDDLVARWTHLARGKVAKYTIRGPRENWPPLLIPGDHNQSNAQATLAILAHLPGPANLAAARQAMAEFKGLPHRLELVHTATINGRPVQFFNDSKATSPQASTTALQAFAPGTAIFVVGGFDKHIDLSPFETMLAQRAGGVIGIGATGGAIVASVAAKSPRDPAHLADAQTLDRAIPLALQWARDLPTVSAIVLSPASASWGQFKNYEERGELFARLAQETTRIR